MSLTVSVTVPNWEEYNPRKDIKGKRSWFRLNNDLFINPKLFRLSLAEKAIWVFILTQCSEGDGKAKIDLEWAEKVAGIPQKAFLGALNKLCTLSCVVRTDPGDVRPDPGATNERTNDTNDTNDTNELSGKPEITSFHNSVSRKLDPIDELGLQRVFAWLNRSTGCAYRANSKANKTLVMALLKDGYTFDDMVAVIRHREYLWKKDPKMRMYLRPSTLFQRSKFEEYLAQGAQYCRDADGTFGPMPEPTIEVSDVTN